MSNKLKVVGLKTAVTLVTLTAGPAHLIFKSLADATVSAESKILNKLTGISEKKLKTSRLKNTEDTQLKVIKIVKKPFNETSMKFKTFVKNHKIKQDVKQTV